MSKKSLLCCTDHADVFPSYSDPTFNPAEQVVAAGNYCVPRIWLALFGPESLVTQTFQFCNSEQLHIRSDGSVETIQVDMYPLSITAPLASRLLCLERLLENVARLELLLGLKSNTLAPHAHALKRALESHHGEFLTIELQEMGGPHGNSKFYDHLLTVLRWFEGADEPQARRACLALGDLDLSRPLLPPRRHENADDLANHDARNQENLLGSGYDRPAPWER